MKKQIPVLLIALLLLAITGSAQKLEPPTLEPTPSTASQKQLINEGVAFHDRGEYDSAISRYEQVLKENPANVEALYELSFTYYLKHDCQKSMEISFRAAQYKSDLLGPLYGEIGNCQDDLGRPNDAIETYKAGIKLLPDNFLLHYNLGLTYARSGQFAVAAPEVKKAASLNPNHTSSQHLLSFLFDKGGFRTPTLLAACRFLILEPTSARSEEALALVQKSMQAGVSRKDNNTISVLMDSAPKKDEGDFGSIEMMMGLLRVGDLSEKKKDQSALQLLVGNFHSLFAVLAEQIGKGDPSKFTWKYYVPYFIELQKQGHTDAFVYYIHQRSNLPGGEQWLTEHQDKVAAFLAWSRAYEWPRG